MLGPEEEQNGSSDSSFGHFFQQFGRAQVVGRQVDEVTGLPDRARQAHAAIGERLYHVAMAELTPLLGRKRAKESARYFLGYTNEKVVSTDFRGEPCASVFDATAGIALDKSFVKIVAWYDNEWGYAKQCLEMVRVVAKKK